jgi:hypothetical protein
MKTVDVVQYFMDKGYKPHQAAAIAGNLTQESSLNPEIINKKSGAFGLAQWLGPRKKALNDFAARQGSYAADPGTQLDFIDHELNTTEKRAKQKLMATTNLEDATNAFSNHFERAGANEKNNTRRISLAQKALDFVIPTASASEMPYQPTRAEWLKMQQQAPQQADQAQPTQVPQQQENVETTPAPVLTRAQWLAQQQQTAEQRAIGNPNSMGEADIAAKRAQMQSQPVGDENTAQKQHGDVSTSRYILNAIRGVGNQALTSAGNILNVPNALDEVVPAVGDTLKGLADTTEVQAQNPGNAVGKFALNTGVQIPAGMAGRMFGAVGPIGQAVTRAGASGLTEGATASGDMIDRAKAAGLGMLGSLGGEALGAGISTALRPFRNQLDPAARALVPRARAMGITLNAADTSGNKSLIAANSALDTLPTSSSMQKAAADAKQEAWTRALYREGGHAYDPTTPGNLGRMREAIGNEYRDLTANNTLQVDPELTQHLNTIRHEYSRFLPTDQKRVVNNYINDITSRTDMSGNVYQATRSKIDKAANGYRVSDPNAMEALRGIRGSLDAAMERNMSPEDALRLRETNRRYMVQKHIEKAIDPVTEQISPAKLMNEVSRRSPDIAKYGRGPQGLTNIAKVGQQFITSKLGDSGTAQRSYMMQVLTNPWGGALTGFSAGNIPGAIAGGLSSLLLPRAASRILQNGENRWLTQGLGNMDRVVPGLGNTTREGLLREVTRQAGVAGSRK